jgi:hypothetical protein
MQTPTLHSTPIRTLLLPAAVAAASVVAISLAPSAATAASPQPPQPSPTKPVAAPLPAKAANEVTFGLGPADAKGLDRRSYYTFSVSPGSKIPDHVAVLNVSDQPVTLNVYPVTVANSTVGDYTFQPQSAKKLDAAPWVHLGLPGGGTELKMAARSTAILPFELTVPMGASPGDHNAGIVADLAAKVTSTGAAQKIAPKLRQRVGLRLFVRVAGPVHPKLEISGIHSSYEGVWNPIGKGSASVRYTLTNTGNVNLGGRQTVEVDGLFGSSAKLGFTTKPKSLPDIPLLLPGNSAQISVHVPGVFPEVWMSVKVKVTPLHLLTDVDPGLTVASGSGHFLAVPWLLVGIIVLLVLGGVAYVRRQRAKAEARRQRAARRKDRALAAASPGKVKA